MTVRATTDYGRALAAFQADYTAAKQTRFRKRLTGVAPLGSHGDYHYRTEADFFRMMELFRHIDRNDMVVGQGITRLVNNVIQDGIHVDPKTDDSELNAELTARWLDWTSDPDACHIAGELTFNAMAKLTLRSVVVDGDVVHLPLQDGALEPIEAHRIRTPRNTKRNVVHGVLLDDHRRRLEYWITKGDVDPHRAVSRVGDVERRATRDKDGNRQVFHVYIPKRFSQTRGISVFAPIADATGMHDDIQFATLVRAQVAACFAIFSEFPDEHEGGERGQFGSRRTEPLADGSARTIEGVSPGQYIEGRPGEKLTMSSPNVPNPEFFPHVMLILGIIAVNLDLPVAVFMLDPTKTNFSGWRGAIDQARIGFRNIQEWMINLFYRPCYLWKLRQWIAEDQALARRANTIGQAFFRHRWNPPAWKYIEPKKDADADTVRLKNALTSPRRLQAERGLNWEEIAAEIVEDRALIIRRAIAEAAEINNENPRAGVDWRELAGMDTKAPAQPPEPNEDDAQNAEAEERQSSERPAAAINAA